MYLPANCYAVGMWVGPLNQSTASSNSNGFADIQNLAFINETALSGLNFKAVHFFLGWEFF